VGEDRGDAAWLRAERLETDLRHLVAERGTDAALTDAMHRLADASEQQILGRLAARHPEVPEADGLVEVPDRQLEAPDLPDPGHES
jgi:hypothetical protein